MRTVSELHNWCESLPIEEYTIRRPPNTPCSIIALKSGREKFWIRQARIDLTVCPTRASLLSAGEQEIPAEYGPL